MDDFDELAGRIEGLARALLHTVAELEAAGLMDGPRLAGAWRSGAPARHRLPAMQTAGRTLRELAQALDDARSWRQARGRPDASRRCCALG